MRKQYSPQLRKAICQEGRKMSKLPRHKHRFPYSALVGGNKKIWYINQKEGAGYGVDTCRVFASKEHAEQYLQKYKYSCKQPEILHCTLAQAKRHTTSNNLSRVGKWFGWQHNFVYSYTQLIELAHLPF